MILSLVMSALQQESKPGSLYYRHPEYTVRWWWREFNRISYLGGREYSRPARLTVEFDYPLALQRNADGSAAIDGSGRPVDPMVATDRYPSMLYRHNREKSWEYENRRRRAHYCNIVATTVNSLVSHALKKGVMRTGDEVMKTFWKQVDCSRKTDIDTFMRDGMRMAHVEGLMWCCVDVEPKPAPGDDGKTAEESDADGLPYAYWVNPLDILDWSVDEDGELLWLKQFVYFEGERTALEAIRPMHRFRIWYPDKVDTYDVNPASGAEPTAPTESKPNPLGRIPFEPLYAKRNHESLFPDGEPLISDLAKSANSIFNYTSLLDEILYKQTFSILTIPDKNVDAVQVGTNTVFGYSPMTTGALPAYISPDPQQAEVLLAAIQAELSRSRQTFGIGQPTDGSKQKSSAAAMELENEDKRSILGDISASAQDFEYRLAALVDAYRTAAAPVMSKTSIEYPADFDLQALQDEVAEALSLRTVGMSPEIMLVIRKGLAGRKLGAMPEDEREKLLNTLTVANDPPATPPPSGNPTKAADAPWPVVAPADGAQPGGAAPKPPSEPKPAPPAPAAAK